jgi:hypothetical protein
MDICQSIDSLSAGRYHNLHGDNRATPLCIQDRQSAIATNATLMERTLKRPYLIEILLAALACVGSARLSAQDELPPTGGCTLFRTARRCTTRSIMSPGSRTPIYRAWQSAFRVWLLVCQRLSGYGAPARRSFCRRLFSWTRSPRSGAVSGAARFTSLRLLANSETESCAWRAQQFIVYPNFGKRKI